MEKAGKVVLFVRVSPEAKAWAEAKAAKKKGLSAGEVVEHLLMYDKNRLQGMKELRKARKAS